MKMLLIVSAAQFRLALHPVPYMSKAIILVPRVRAGKSVLGHVGFDPFTSLPSGAKTSSRFCSARGAGRAKGAGIQPE